MVSFNVTLLFTSNYLDIAKKITKKILQEHYPGKSLGKQTIYELAEICLYACFKFSIDMHKQIKGAPTVPSISRLLAEVVIQALKSIALPRIQSNVCVRYVDDNFVTIKRSNIKENNKIIKNIFKGINFVIELEIAGKLTFMDSLVYRSASCTLQTRVYHEQIHTEQMINYHSIHSKNKKRPWIGTYSRDPKLAAAQED